MKENQKKLIKKASLASFISRNINSFAPIFIESVKNPLGALSASFLGRGSRAANFYSSAANRTSSEAAKKWLAEEASFASKPFSELPTGVKFLVAANPVANTLAVGSTAKDFIDNSKDPNKSFSGNLVRAAGSLSPFALNLPLSSSLFLGSYLAPKMDNFADRLDKNVRLR